MVDGRLEIGVFVRGKEATDSLDHLLTTAKVRRTHQYLWRGYSVPFKLTRISRIVSLRNQFHHGFVNFHSDESLEQTRTGVRDGLVL